MDERHQRLPFRPDVPWSVQLAEHKARSIDALDRAREVLKEALSCDTFLGRQHYEILPLPHEELDRLENATRLLGIPGGAARTLMANATQGNARAIDRTGARGQSCA
jgi:hypothetical protein